MREGVGVTGPKRGILDAMKRAIMLEVHGLRFYQVASERCCEERTRELFLDLAADELRHKEELETQFRGILEGHATSIPKELPVKKDLRFTDPILSKELKDRIQDAWFESAALAIGIMLERRAIEYYKRKEASSEDPRLRALFSWLLRWEKSHLHRLMALERSMREAIWHEARFWPLD